MILNVRVRTVDGEPNLARNIPRLIFRIIQSSAIDCSIDYVAYRSVTKVFVVFNTYVGCSDCMKIYVLTPAYPYGALIPQIRWSPKWFFAQEAAKIRIPDTDYPYGRHAPI